MGKDNKKVVEAITPMQDDFAKWYTDVVKKAELIDYSSVKGCVILRPNGYAIWENIQKVLDQKFKETGHENVYMPMFIPESLLKKEEEHVEGFAPEVAFVTQGGDNVLTERLVVRPTSEVLFCEHYSKIIQSYNDLPKLYNQWCSVVRWEKNTRPFLRTTEFLWQEGHTLHATQKEAEEETLRMLNTYSDFCEKYLAIPVIKGQKTDKEKFAGAVATYTIESLMHDGKALQSGTSHFFGDKFAKAFDITFSDKDGKLKNPMQTSWGLSTRIIGALIMVHGDDNGLKLPPNIAPTQLVVIPIAMHKEGVTENVTKLYERLSKKFRCKIDISDKTPGWKFSEYEVKGIPLRVEMGPKDIENNQVVLVRRDNREKIVVSLDDLENSVEKTLSDIQDSLYQNALNHRNDNTFVALNYEELGDIAENKPGFIKAMWCGDDACEQKIKDDYNVTSRCIPFEQENLSDTCVCCSKPAKSMLYLGKSY